MSLTGTAVALLQVVLTVGAAPLLVGIMRLIHARLEGRAGPPIVQPWRDLRKLLGKERMVSDNTGWVFSIAPLVLLASAALVAGIVPFLSTQSALDQVGDLFAVVYLLLLGTVFLSLAGLDAGTAFGGMGASRSMTITAIAEPTVLVAIFALSVSTGSSNLGAIVAATLAHPSDRGVAREPAGIRRARSGDDRRDWSDTRRQPQHPSRTDDDPRGDGPRVLRAGPRPHRARCPPSPRRVPGSAEQPLHTVGHRHDGPAAGAARRCRSRSAAKILLLATVIAVVEVFTAKVRLFRVPELLAASFVLAFLAVTASFFLA